MKIAFRITSQDGNVEEVKVRPATLIAFEQDGHSMQDETKPVTNLYLLAFYAMGKPGKSFEKWVETLDDLESIEDDAEGGADLPTTAGSPA